MSPRPRAAHIEIGMGSVGEVRCRAPMSAVVWALLPRGPSPLASRYRYGSRARDLLTGEILAERSGTPTNYEEPPTRTSRPGRPPDAPRAAGRARPRPPATGSIDPVA